MSNPEHLAKLREGVETWNRWRELNPGMKPDLLRADLSGTDLTGPGLIGVNLSEADLSEANLSGADLTRAFLVDADLRDADLTEANLYDAFMPRADLLRANLFRALLSKADLFSANLYKANLSEADLAGVALAQAYLAGANLFRANLTGVDLTTADLTGADLSEAHLNYATLVETNLEGANLTSCSVYGVSAWNVRLKGAAQSNLVITRHHESVIQVDNLEVAQFIYLLLNNEKIRHVIDTVTSKMVLILGRFTQERKAILDEIREQLRKKNYVPVLFDFEKPVSKDMTGTITTLASMARFIIADLTDPSSVPHELEAIVPGTIAPVQAILLDGQREYTMFLDLKRRYHWVLEPYRYKSEELLIAHLYEWVIAPAEAKAKELTRK